MPSAADEIIAMVSAETILSTKEQYKSVVVLVGIRPVGGSQWRKATLDRCKIGCRHYQNEANC